MTIVNLLEDPNKASRDFLNHAWNVSSGTASVARTTRQQHSGAASLLITAAATSVTVRSHTPGGDYTPSVTGNSQYKAALWFRHATVGRQITLGIAFYDVAGVSLTSSTTTASMGYGDWTLAKLTATAPATAASAVVTVTMAGVDLASAFDKYLYLDDVSLVSTALPYSAWISAMAQYLPGYMKEADESQTNPTIPLARYIDLMASRGQIMLDLYNAINYVSPVDGGAVGDTSALVNPGDYPNSETKEEWLTWLSQLLAVRSSTVPGGSTSWASLAALYATWGDWESGINTTAAAAAVSISGKTRSAGTSTITTSAAHGLAVGDSVVISGATTFNGTFTVTAINSSTSFSYSQRMPLLSVLRTTTTVTATAGLAHNYASTNSVVVTGTGTGADGTWTVTGTSTTDDLANVFTFTTGTSGAIAKYSIGETYPADVTVSTAGGTSQIGSDLTWVSLEQKNPYPVASDTVLAYLLRTGASGVWAGTVEGLKRAARLGLSGIDMQATMTCVGGTATVQTVAVHGLTVGATVEMYGSPEDSLNRTYTVVSVPSTTTFTVACGTEPYVVSTWVTNKLVTVLRGYWSGVPSTISTAGGSMTVTFNTQLPFTTSAAPVVISGTGNVSVDTTHNPASVTIASNRLSVTFPSSVSLGSALTPSDARVRLVGNLFCLIVRTLSSQTAGAGTVLAFADQAKPAGGVISHEYTA
jgi:hypothetical protein